MFVECHLGKVIDTTGRYAELQIDPADECRTCSLRRDCPGSDGRPFEVRARNGVGARSDDAVWVNVSHTRSLVSDLMLATWVVLAFVVAFCLKWVVHRRTHLLSLGSLAGIGTLLACWGLYVGVRGLIVAWRGSRATKLTYSVNRVVRPR